MAVEVKEGSRRGRQPGKKSSEKLDVRAKLGKVKIVLYFSCNLSFSNNIMQPQGISFCCFNYRT